MSVNKSILNFFDHLERHLEGYEKRISQLKMAEFVYKTVNNDERLLVEAGTGTGKTFAYLIPIIMSGKKAVISTATIALQEQLARKDLAQLKAMDYKDFRFGILKGKNNYLCPKRFHEYGSIRVNDKSFYKWVQETESGDKDDMPTIPDFWQEISGDSKDCAGRDCPFYERCFFYKVYKRLYDVDIIVTNHYMLVYDFITGGSLIPNRDVLIIDEAHHIDSVISKVAGITISHSRIKWLLNRLKGLKIVVDLLYTELDECFRVEKSFFNKDINIVTPPPETIIQRLRKFYSKMSLDIVKETLEKEKDFAVDAELKDRIKTTINCCVNLDNDIKVFLKGIESQMVYYVQKEKNHIEFQSRLIETQEIFNHMIDAFKSVIMTSATITTRGNFDFFKARLGLNDFGELILDSPFDYKSQSAMYVARDLPPPTNEEIFLSSIVKIIEDLIEASRGRALVLFTSYRHLNYVAENIKINYPLALQGEMPNAKLLKWFTDTPGSVLLATQTFWHGVDVKGEKLSLLIIAKIPFISPGDPVYDARCKKLEDRWFYELALPTAILNIRQGFGRLIRSINDKGVVAILDSRLEHSNYGRDIISSLPVMNRLTSLEEVKRFFAF